MYHPMTSKCFSLTQISPWYIRLVHPTAHSTSLLGCTIDISNNISHTEPLISSKPIPPSHILLLFIKLLSSTPSSSHTAQNPGMTLDSSLCLTHCCIWSINQNCWLYFQNTARLCLLPTTPTAASNHCCLSPHSLSITSYMPLLSLTPSPFSSVLTTLLGISYIEWSC